MTNNGELPNNTIDKHINQAIKELEDYPVDFCHARLTVDQILAQMRAGIRRGVGVFVIDQLSKISYNNYKLTQKQRYDEIVDKISNFAKSEEVLVILLSQCNREINGREEKTPRDSDVSDTDRLLQEADVLLVGAWKDPAICANWLVVNRHGTSGHIEEITWNKSLAIYELSQAINGKK
jgi:replicative DNA helicase